MKFFAIIFSIILFANVAYGYSRTYNRPIPHQETISVKVDLPNGKSTVLVSGSHQENISCVFIDKGTGNIAYASYNTTSCIGNADISLPSVIIAKITNNTNSDMQVNITVYSL